MSRLHFFFLFFFCHIFIPFTVFIFLFASFYNTVHTDELHFKFNVFKNSLKVFTLSVLYLIRSFGASSDVLLLTSLQQSATFEVCLLIYFPDHSSDFHVLVFPLRSPKSLLCVVPDVSVFSDGWRCLRRVITVPLSLVRLDGLIYRTSYSFTYTPELQPPPSARMTAGGGKREGGMGGGQDDDILLETIHQEFTRANFHLFMQS